MTRRPPRTPRDVPGEAPNPGELAEWRAWVEWLREGCGLRPDMLRRHVADKFGLLLAEADAHLARLER